MSVVPQCIFCGKGLANEAPEHIILDALGGRMTTTRVDCTGCNHRLGNEIDKPLAEVFGPIRNMTNTLTGSGDPPPTLRDVRLADGSVIDLLPGYKPVPKRVVYLRDHGEVKIGVASVERLAAQIDNFAKGLKLTREQLVERLASAQATVASMYSPEQIPWSFSFGGRVQERAVTKAALLLWALRTSNDVVRSPAYERARFFADGNASAPSVARLTFSNCPFAQLDGYPRSEFVHRLSVWTDGGGRAVGYYQLFGHVGFVVNLAEGDVRDATGHFLAVNPVSRAWRYDELDPASLPACSSIDAMVTRQEDGRAAMTALMTSVVEKLGREADEELARKAATRALPKDGEMIDDEHIGTLSHDVAEHLVARIFGHTVTASMSGEAIVEELRRLLAQAKDDGCP